MQTNNHKIVDYDAVLDAKFGKEGAPERARAEEAAYSFYSGQILQNARKDGRLRDDACLGPDRLVERYQPSYINDSCIPGDPVLDCHGAMCALLKAVLKDEFGVNQE